MEEEEVCKLLQECLAMRLKYLFQETVQPWQKESCAVEADANETSGTSNSDTADPFQFVPEPASSVCTGILISSSYCLRLNDFLNL